MNWNLLLIWATEVENINDLNRELGRHLEGNKLTSLRGYGGYIGNARNGELTWRIIAPASEGREPVVGSLGITAPAHSFTRRIFQQRDIGRDMHKLSRFWNSNKEEHEILL